MSWHIVVYGNDMIIPRKKQLLILLVSYRKNLAYPINIGKLSL